MPSKHSNAGGLRTKVARSARFAALAAIAAGVAAIAGSGVSAAAGEGPDPVAAAVPTPGILAPPDAIVDEAEGTVDFAVTLADEGTQTVTVGYQTQNASAGAGTVCNTDYSLASGTLTFAPGERTKDVPIQIRDCADAEGFESLTLNLHTAVNGQIWRTSSRISIVDNDTIAPTPSLSVRDAVVDEKAGKAFVSVLLGGTAGRASNSTVTVDYTTAAGTAAADSDYETTSGTFTFSPGETVESVAIPIAEDATPEGVESFAFTISNPNNASIADGSGVVTIGASDAADSSQPAILAPVDLVVGEADGFVDLVVALSAPSANLVTVTYTALNGSAGLGNVCNTDYGVESGLKLNFAPGETTKPVRVQINECADAELLEAFTLNLSLAENGLITRASGRISIVDNDPVIATPKLFARDAVVDERDDFAYVSVLLGGPGGEASNSLVSVDYATANDSASADSDFTGVSGTLRFAPGETAKTVVVPITDDGSTEGVESFALTLSAPNQATISDRSGRIVIGASDAAGIAQPRILATPDLIVGETDGWVDLVVNLSQPGLSPVTVDYATANASAGGGNVCNTDYSPANGKLHFAVGETTKAVRVQINDCADAELFEAFTFGLSGPENAAIARASGRISLVDNDNVVGTPKLTVRDAVVDEKDGFAYVSVLLGGTGSEASNSSVTVDYASANGSAADADFTAVDGTLTFAPGETAKTIVVPIADDGTPEPAESFTLELDNASQATILDGLGTVTIGTSDAAAAAQPGISAPVDVAVIESVGFVDLVVRLSQPGLNPVTVDYATANVSAGGGNVCNTDYSLASGKLQFAVGETTKAVRVQINDCLDAELGETFNFNLSVPVNGSIFDGSGVVTICDNDGPVGLCSIAVTPANPAIALGANQQFTATGISSDLSSSDLTATATWASANTGVATIVSGGLAHGLLPGTSTISASQGGIAGSTILTVTGQAAQTISFSALANKSYGDADFAVSATASSGLPVSFAAAGNCTISGASVHITGAGSCTITASQSGNASFAPAASVARTFAIAKAAQTISFAALASKKVGDPDFTVNATASSGLPVSFAASGNCSVSAARVHLIAAGSCTITASQAGNANYNAAAAVARTFSIARKALPVRCRVPRVIGKQLAAARSALSKAHCRTGTVTRVFSRTKRRGIVIGQSRRPGQVLRVNSKVNLVVSRGRR